MTHDFLQIGYSKLDNLVQGGFSSRIHEKRINKNDNFVKVLLLSGTCFFLFCRVHNPCLHETMRTLGNAVLRQHVCSASSEELQSNYYVLLKVEAMI